MDITLTIKSDSAAEIAEVTQALVGKAVAAEDRESARRLASLLHPLDTTRLYDAAAYEIDRQRQVIRMGNERHAEDERRVAELRAEVERLRASQAVAAPLIPGPTARDGVVGMLVRCGYSNVAFGLADGGPPASYPRVLRSLAPSVGRDREACIAALEALAALEACRVGHGVEGACAECAPNEQPGPEGDGEPADKPKLHGIPGADTASALACCGRIKCPHLETSAARPKLAAGQRWRDHKGRPLLMQQRDAENVEALLPFGQRATFRDGSEAPAEWTFVGGPEVEPASMQPPTDADERWQPGAVWEHRSGFPVDVLRLTIKSVSAFPEDGPKRVTFLEPRCARLAADMTPENGWRYIGRPASDARPEEPAAPEAPAAKRSPGNLCDIARDATRAAHVSGDDGAAAPAARPDREHLGRTVHAAWAERASADSTRIIKMIPWEDLMEQNRGDYCAVGERLFDLGAAWARKQAPAVPRVYPVTAPAQALAERMEAVIAEVISEPADGELRARPAALRVLRLVEEHLRGGAPRADGVAAAGLTGLDAGGGP